MLSSAKLVPAKRASQACCVRYCHWTVVVLHQLLREIVYLLILGPVYQLKWAITCRKRPVKAAGSVPGCTKRVCFVRHGQGDHNASLKGWKLCDPPLNATGEDQVRALADQMKPRLKEFELIVVSPLTRAMQTATGGFAGAKASWMLQPLLRERMGAPCDTGRSKSELLQSFPQLVRWKGIDELDEVWWSTSFIEWDLMSRVEQLEDWISARPEKTIAVVGHGGLFSRSLGHHLKNCGYQWVDWDASAAKVTTTLM